MPRSGLLSRLPFLIALLSSALLLGVLLGTSQLDAAKAGDDVLGGADQFLTDDGLSTVRSDLDRIDATFAQMATDPEFAAAVEADPALSERAARLPEVRAVAEKVVTNLEERQDQFESAASLPGLGLDLAGATIGLLLIAGVAVLAALAGLARPTRWAAAIVLVAGVAVAGTPLTLGHLDKAADTDALLDSLRPFSEEKVEVREAGLADVRAVFDAYDGTAVPAEDLATTEEAIDRFGVLVEFSRTAQPLLVDATTQSATTIARLSIGTGAALAIAGVAGLVTARRRTDVIRFAPSEVRGG